MTDMPSIAFITLGCAKNEVDSDKMRAKLRGAGYVIVDDPASADLTIINTCSFLAAAVEEGLDVIFEALGTIEGGVEVNRVLVAGCMPSRYGDDLESELPEVAGFLPADQEDEVVEKVDAIFGRTSTGQGSALRDLASASAYVKISDGCDRFCSYCMIPYIRGRYHSFAYDDIRDEVEQLVASGVREIVLIGQDTGIWGQDLPEPSCTKDLLEGLAVEFPETWFRIMYIQPEGINDDLLAAMRDIPNVCSYIDIPLQHVNADVLKAMNRTGSKEQIEALIAHIRETVPNMLIRTTLMTGFPGETQEQFEELLEFAQTCDIDYAGVFAYSQEEGSAAAEFPNQVDEDVRKERAQQVLDACDERGFARNKTHIGKVVDVIVEGYEETDIGIEALARWQGQAPDVDGQVHIPMSNGVAYEIGDRLTVKLTESFCYELEGEAL